MTILHALLLYGGTGIAVALLLWQLWRALHTGDPFGGPLSDDDWNVRR